MSMRRSLPRIALTIVLAAIAGWVVLHRDQINLATLDAWLAWLGPWAPIGHMMQSCWRSLVRFQGYPIQFTTS